MAATSSFVPVELYLRSTYEPDAEYIDGRIEERTVGELPHALWQDALLAWFRSHAAEWNLRALPEVRVQVATNRFRVPDVVVLRPEQLLGRIVTTPPVAVFEILSPEDTFRRTLEKLPDYEAMGIDQIWVIDPEDRIFFRYAQGGLAQAVEYGSAGETIHFAMREVEAFLE